MPVTDLFLADLRRDLAGGPLHVDELLDRWTGGAPARRKALRARLSACAELGVITIDDRAVVRLTGHG